MTIYYFTSFYVEEYRGTFGYIGWLNEFGDIGANAFCSECNWIVPGTTEI